MSYFTDVKALPEDSLFSLKRQIEEARAKGVDVLNLAVGEYLEENSTPEVFTVVREAEEKLLREEKTKGYSAILGNNDFNQEVISHIYGKEVAELLVCQTLGGTGALSISARILYRVLGIKKILISDPSWANHKNIFSEADLDVENYPYYNFAEGLLDFEKMISTLENENEPAAVLLHVCCHNPTGIDLTKEQWDHLAMLFQSKDNLIPVMDMAYHGFAEGFTEDAYAVRSFQKKGIEYFLCYSFSKNMGLYGERLGALICHTKCNRAAIKSQIARIQRTTVSNPPIHPMKMALIVLKERKEAWSIELGKRRKRLNKVRESLSEVMGAAKFKLGFGMFVLAGTERVLEQSFYEELKQRGIYMPRSSRLNITGLLGEENRNRFVKGWNV